ncbi:hypothetical protein ACIG3E_23400 [Streptomyces sp. NPDC053474]|uniref:hypothetical protein n=1 Tax=Streptomyces sp. NPDC053474 TaxID=3365704 RepID=UPI0037CEEFDD
MRDVLAAVLSGMLPPLPGGTGALLRRIAWGTAVMAAVVAPFGVWARAWWRMRARRALRGRAVVDLVPTAAYDPSPEECARQAAHLTQASRSLDWLPRRAAGVRIRHYCVGGELACSLEGPPRSAALVRMPSFAHVDVIERTGTPHGGERIHFDGAPPLPGTGRSPAADHDEDAEGCS